MSSPHWCCPERNCGFLSKSRKGCLIHFAKRHAEFVYTPMDPPTGHHFGAEHGGSPPFLRDWHLHSPLWCRRRQKGPEPFQRPAAPADPSCPSTNGPTCGNKNEPDSGISQSTTADPHDRDQTNPNCSWERVDSHNSPNEGIGPCSANQRPFSCGFQGLCSSDSPPIFGCHAQSPCDAPGSSRDCQTTVESQTHYRRVIHTKRSKRRFCEATSECTTGQDDIKSTRSTDCEFNSGCQSPCPAQSMLRDLWPTRLSGCAAVPENADGLRRPASSIKVCVIFMSLLGECIALDYLPGHKWDIVVRCSVCKYPLGGMQNIEEHLKEHLELVGHRCSLCELPRGTPADAPHHEPCCAENDDQVPTSTPGDVPPAAGFPSSKRPRAKSF